MQVLIAVFLLAFAALAAADCSVANFAKDPTPWGGANCTNDKDCGGGTVLGGGVCDFTGGAGNCICPKGRGKPDCSYVRGNKDLPGGLNIGLCWIGIGGVGNIIGGRIPSGAGQLVLTLSIYLLCFAACFAYCCCGEASGSFIVVVYIVLLCAYLAGIGWSIADGAYFIQCVYPDALGYAYNF